MGSSALISVAGDSSRRHRHRTLEDEKSFCDAFGIDRCVIMRHPNKYAKASSDAVHA